MMLIIVATNPSASAAFGALDQRQPGRVAHPYADRRIAIADDYLIPSPVDGAVHGRENLIR